MRGADVLSGRSGRRAGLLPLLGLSITILQSAQAMPAPDGVRGREGDRPVAELRPASVTGGGRAAPARHAFEGFWAADRTACADPDSDGRMAIGPGVIQWYETRCRIGMIAPAGRSAWRLSLDCRGEGQHIATRATVRLPASDALVIEDGPIGHERRQRYIRCRSR